VLGTGGSINVGIVAEAHRGVDTPADYAEFVRWYREGGEGGAGGTRRAA
jgi:3-deoxy-manno-octulosonate cytidylyltransferase (CMP-KDO synthetase)